MHIYICIYVCIYVYLCVCMCVCICVLGEGAACVWGSVPCWCMMGVCVRVCACVWHTRSRPGFHSSSPIIMYIGIDMDIYIVLTALSPPPPLQYCSQSSEYATWSFYGGATRTHTRMHTHAHTHAHTHTYTHAHSVMPSNPSPLTPRPSHPLPLQPSLKPI